jgi:hypothetical protein
VPVKPSVAVKVAVKTFGSAVGVRPLSVPPTAVVSARVKPTGASLKVKVTVDTLSPVLFRVVSTMSTTTLGATVSMGTVSLLPLPVLPAVSV